MANHTSYPHESPCHPRAPGAARHQEAQRGDSRVIHPRPVPQARAAAGCSTREAAPAELR